MDNETHDERAIRQINEVHAGIVARVEKIAVQARKEETDARQRRRDAQRLIEARTHDWAQALRGRGQAAAEAVPWVALWHYDDKWEASGGSDVAQVCRELPLLVGILGTPLTITFNGYDLVCDDEFVSPTWLYDGWLVARRAR
jgi:hypothetical protein